MVQRLRPTAATEQLESPHAFQGDPSGGANGIVVVHMHDAPQGGGY